MLKRKISVHEIIGDILFIMVSMFVSFLMIYIFDIHWSFYPGETILPPSKHIFKDATPYYVGVPFGGIVGFILLKIIFYAFQEEKKGKS